MIVKIPRCYDSHVHLLATGQVLMGLDLRGLKNLDDLKTLAPTRQHFRDKWLVGFGWNQHDFTNKKIPSKNDLDSTFPDFPVAFTRADGHAVWCNSQAISQLKSNGLLAKLIEKYPDQVILDSHGEPTGVFFENAKIEIDLSLPNYSHQQVLTFYREANHYFLSKGFTHVRDMTGNIYQWETLKEMADAKQLSLFVEMNFVVENFADFPRTVGDFVKARGSQTEQLRAAGLKFFYDGALGSEGALLSKPYGERKSAGFRLWDKGNLANCLAQAWSQDIPVSVHAIGDQAAHEIAEIALEVSSFSKKGALHIEHAQVVRSETIAIFRHLAHHGFKIHFHMQPCHFLSDQVWLKDKLGDQFRNVFPWMRIQKAGFQIHWGSDSPIEMTSVPETIRALREAEAAGIPNISGSPWLYHSHPDESWGPRAVSEFELD